MKKICILNEDRRFLPNKCNIKYPPYNSNNGYSVEQDFYDFLKGSEYYTTNEDEADYFYIAVFWQWHCFNNSYYMNPSSLIDITQYLNSLNLKDRKVFMVSQIDGGPLGCISRRPMLNDSCTIYTACAGHSEPLCKNIKFAPLLTSEHPILAGVHKKYYSSFVGRLNTHPVRAEMANILNGKGPHFIYDGYLSDYGRIIQESLIGLCPRGCGLSSYRIFECMQLGTVPLIIADHDIRPFKEHIDWDRCSLYINSLNDLEYIMKKYSNTELLQMGENAKSIFYEKLNYRKWCNLLIEDLFKE